MIVLGIVIGFIVGALALGWPGGIAGGFVGFIVTLAWRSRVQARERMRQQMPRPVAAAAPSVPHADTVAAPSIAQRIAAVELRLAALERHAGVDVQKEDPAPLPLVSPAPEVAIEPVASMADSGDTTTPPLAPIALTLPDVMPEQAPPAALPDGFVRTPDGTLAPATIDAAPAPVAPLPPASAAPAPARTVVPATANPLWAWFTGGNTLTRIGVFVLFFGVAFLLKYFADLITIPIEIKLLGVALVGGALVVLGLRLARTRPGYGLSLEGAGTGILYLTIFAAFRLYDVLPAAPAFALLVATTVLAVGLAIRADSQPLAGIAIAGGFLAPFLVATSAGAPARLFGYFAVLNAAIFALAWVRSWRALNVLGFIFTFALGLFWGERFYRPEHFATVEPFLVLFFLYYVAIAVLYAKRGGLEAKAPVDALLVFGVPLIGFALQASMVYDTRYGVAISAVGMAAVYGVLALALLRRPEPGLGLLARAFAVLAIIFATVAIPFAADPQWTTAWWSLEAAGVYWIGCRQRQGLARGFALLLQLGAALAFVAGGMEGGDRLFLNATFFGTTLIALAALATAFIADRNRDAVTGNERALVPLLMAWAACWWYGGAALELSRALPERVEANAILAFAVGSVACALLLRRWLRWSRLAWLGVALLPIMAVAALADWDRMRTTLLAYGWLVWPLAWVTHWRMLRAADALRVDEVVAGTDRGRAAAFLRFAHAASAIAVVAWVAWEGSEWVGRVFPPATVWVACAAALPAIAYLTLMSRVDDARFWPFTEYREAYAASAGTTIAALLAVWFVIVNAISPGDAAPLPYSPIVNPLDLTLIAALAVLLRWARDTMRAAERPLYGWFGAALFLFLNAIVFRTVHQWLDVPWRLAPLLASKPLQAALTLTWTATALPLMLIATRRSIRPLWMVGAALLAVVVVKLFVLDLSALSGLPRVVAFLGVGVLLLLIGYLAPLPPASSEPAAR